MGFLQSCVREGTALRKVSEVEDVTTNLKTLTVHTVSSCDLNLNSEDLSRSPSAAHGAFLSAWFFFFGFFSIIVAADFSGALSHSAAALRPLCPEDTQTAEPTHAALASGTPHPRPLNPALHNSTHPLHPASPDPYAPSPRAKTRDA